MPTYDYICDACGHEFEAFESILEARAREHSMKRWRRAWKIALIEKLNPGWRDLTDDLSF